jgi:hypothetical protein
MQCFVRRLKLFARLSITVALLLPAARYSLAQAGSGELRLFINDPMGARLGASVHVQSTGNGFDQTLTTDVEGHLTLHALPFGLYLISVKSPSFAPANLTVAVHTALPIERTIQLATAPVLTQVNVSNSITVLDPQRVSGTMEIGNRQIQQRLSSLPGRSVQDLVVTQPGWLYEGNGVLHPRGSEYQTQFVLDGIPLLDNRSPGFGPEIEADDLDSVTIYTAGFPAEYGRKLGGVIELDTRPLDERGTHGQVVLNGGSYDTAAGYARLANVFGHNALSASAGGSMSAHYLNPVVPENYTNRGTTGDFAMRFDRDFTASDRLTLDLRHELSRFEIPNEIVQQRTGQLETGDTFETIGTVRFQHIFSPDSLLTLAGMVRNNANDLDSNADSTPIIAFQHSFFNEGYFKADFAHQVGRHEIKAGIESDAFFLHENFNYTVTDPAQFDDSTPTSLTFSAHRPDLEQSAFIEDFVHYGAWTVAVGLRWDHYQLQLNQNAFSPRLSVGRYIPALGLLLHASFDRIFQTPSFENILISSSPQASQLDYPFLHLPVQPSRGNDYEAGASKAFFSHLRLDTSVYRRNARNYADDDQLLNTGVSYPIAFDHAIIYGIDSKLTLIENHGWSGYASYSYMVGNVWLPVTGGLFLGDDANIAVSQISGHLPDSQDQRNTLVARERYQLTHHLWLAAGASYGSGLPFEFAGTLPQALAEYGPAVISHLNFDRGRIHPQISANASAGIDLYRRDARTITLQIDSENLNNHLNVIDFGGLFSGNAIGPARSIFARLTTTF